MYCTNCGKEVNEKAIACPSCGFSPKSEKNYCYECGAPTKEKQIICTNCGVELKNGTMNFSIDSASIKNPFQSTKKLNVTALISSIFMIVSLFLPWIKGAYNILNSQFNDFIGPYGYFMLLFGILSSVGVFLKYKKAFIGGILYLSTLIIAVIDIIDKVGSFSHFIDFDKIFSSGIGAILAIISGLLFIIFSLVNSRDNEKNTTSINTINSNKFKTNILKFIKTEYFKVGLPFFLFFTGLFLNLNLESSYYSFPLLTIIFLCYPIYYSYKKYKPIYSLLVYFIIVAISKYIMSNYINCINPYCSEIKVAMYSAISITYYFFFSLLFISIIIIIKNKKSEILAYNINNKIIKGFTLSFYEFFEKNNTSISNIPININKVSKLNNHNWKYLIIFLVVFFSIKSIINTSKIVRLSDKELQNIVKPYNDISGEWVFEIKNSSNLINLKIDSMYIEQVNYTGRIDYSQKLLLNNRYELELFKFGRVNYKDFHIDSIKSFSNGDNDFENSKNKVIKISEIFKDSLIGKYNKDNFIAYRRVFYQKRKEEEKRKELELIKAKKVIEKKELTNKVWEIVNDSIFWVSCGIEYFNTNLSNIKITSVDVWKYEGSIKSPIFTIKDNDKNDVLMFIEFNYDFDTKMFFKDKLSIQIFSKQIKTIEGISIGSSIDKFINIYPDYSFWYEKSIDEEDICYIKTKLPCKFIIDYHNNKEQYGITRLAKNVIDYSKKIEMIIINLK